MVKTLFWESSDNWEKVLNKLIEDKVIDLCIWVGTNKKCSHQVHSFDYCNIQDYRYGGFNQEIYDDICHHIYKFMDMYCRNYRPDMQNVYGNKTLHDYLNIFNILSEYFTQLLIINKIELVVMSRFPHLGADYLMYVVAKVLGIKTLLFYQTIFPERFFYIHSLEDFGKFEEIVSIRDKETKLSLHRTYKDCRCYIQSYMKNISDDNLESKFRPYLYLDKQNLKKIFPSIFVNDDVLERAYNIEINLREQLYNQMITQNSIIDVNLSENYVYFPLHLQPEMTTSTLGREYGDQVLAVERLAQLLPEKWYIYVKENPKQRYFMRGLWFFHRLLAIRNVRLISKKINTLELLLNSKFVATITGTVGWEALFEGKNVLVFGNSWYKSLPGVFSYDKGIKIQDILNYKLSHEELEREFDILMSKTGEGIVYGANISKNGNIEKVSRNIKNIIETME